MEPKLAFDLIRQACSQRQDLRWRDWTPEKMQRARERPFVVHVSELEGMCYIATEVFCVLVEGARPYCGSDRMHFWAQVGDTIWDPTHDQFSDEYLLIPYPYDKGRPTRFKKLSKRAHALLEEVMHIKSGVPREAHLMGGVPHMWGDDDAST